MYPRLCAGAASLTWGRLADVRGLAGESGVSRLELQALPGDAGGPVLDDRGAVVGLLQDSTDATRELPADVAFAVDGATLAAFLSEAGVTVPAAVNRSAILEPVTLARRAREMTALVSCWE